nr:MAG TPA: hypothetical protein [Caudoviricetes sp.]
MTVCTPRIAASPPSSLRKSIPREVILKAVPPGSRCISPKLWPDK